MADNHRTLRNTISDTVYRFFWDDRKEDDDLPRGRIEEMVQNGEITKEEIIEMFAEQIRNSL